MNLRHPMDSSPVVFVAFGEHLFGMDRRTGNRIWNHRIPWATNIRLAADDVKVYALGGGLSCLDGATGRVLWFVEKVSGDTLLLHDGQLFVGGAGELRCFSAVDGALLWVDIFKGMGMGDVAIAVPWAVAQSDRSG